MIVFLCQPQLYLSVGIRSVGFADTAGAGFRNNGTVKKAEIWPSVWLDRALSTLKLLQSVKNVQMYIHMISGAAQWHLTEMCQL